MKPSSPPSSAVYTEMPSEKNNPKKFTGWFARLFSCCSKQKAAGILDNQLDTDQPSINGPSTYPGGVLVSVSCASPLSTDETPNAKKLGP